MSSGSTTLSVAQRLWQTLPPPSGGSTHPTIGKIQHLPTWHAHLWHMPSPNRVNRQLKSERGIQLTGDKHEIRMFGRSEGMTGWGCLGTLGETWHQWLVASPPCSPHFQPAWPSRAHCALCVYRQTVEDQHKQKAHVSLHSSCGTWPSADYLASQIPGRSALSCQSRALGEHEEEEEDPEPPKGSEPPRRTAPRHSTAGRLRRAQLPASEKAEGSQWRVRGVSRAEAWALGDLRRSVPPSAPPHSACLRLPDIHSL